MPTKKKVNAIFRRLDIDANCKINFSEFSMGIKPVDVYFTDAKDDKGEILLPQRLSEPQLN
jgi:hypothetical protein